MTERAEDEAAEPTASDGADGDGFELTAEQEQALVLDRNVAITAGAGTGKTTALTERYVSVLAANPDLTPENVVTITFTRKAAAELTERVRGELYGRLAGADDADAYERWRGALDELEDGYVHTIHAFCARILREHAVEAPVPLGFDVLDEEGAATLQRELASEFLDRHQDDDAVRLLARLWGRDRLTDVLAGLLSERPRSEAVLRHWQDKDPEAYVDVLWDVVCELEGEAARETLYDGLIDQFRELSGRVPCAFDGAEPSGQPSDSEQFGDSDRFTGSEESDESAVSEESTHPGNSAPSGRSERIDDDDGLEAYRTFVSLARELPEEPSDCDPRECQRAILELYECCEKQSGGLYSSAGYVVGNREDWGEYGDVYDDLKAVVDAVIAAVEPHADAVETTPGELETTSAHYALALAEVYEGLSERYAAEKTRRKALDFPDVIGTTIEFLREHEEVRDRLQDRFAAVMVDEFQDTDPRQWELVKLVSGVDTGDATNVFLVGDEKQSIYGFRGADVTTFGDARAELRAVKAGLGLDRLPEGATSEATDPTERSPTSLELSGNFRTLGEPLGFLNALFDRLFRPEDDEHAPFEARPQRLSRERDRVEEIEGLDGGVEYLLVPDDAETAGSLLGEDHPVAEGALDHAVEGEARALAARLTELFAEPPTVQDPETGTHRDAEPADVAILLRRRTHLDRFQRALDRQEIPYTVVGGIGFYDTPEVQALTNLLRVLGDPTDDVSLYGVLRSPLFGFRDDRLAPAVADADSVWAGLQSSDDPQLRDAYELLSTWRTLGGCGTPGDEGVLAWDRLLSRVIDTTGFLASVSADEGGRQAVENVEKFREQLRGWSENSVHTAAGLLHRIDRQAAADPREGEAAVPGDTEGVRIMTIHAAKGLEFPVVAVPELGSRLNFGRSVDDHGYVRLVAGTEDAPPLPAVGAPNPSDAFSVEKTAVHEYADRQSLPKERAEAKRVLYVACTRARDRLLLCGTHDVSHEEASGELSLGEPEPFDDVDRWRDWLQPALLDDEFLGELFRTGSVQRSTDGAPYTVRAPPRPVPWRTPEGSDKPLPAISIPSPPEIEPAKRVAATALVQAVAERAGGHGYGEERTDDTATSRDSSSGDSGLSPTTLGTVVHRIAELRPPRPEWESFVQRVARMNDERPTPRDVEAAISHAADAVAYVERVESASTVEAAHDEYSVTARVGGGRIVGDIDRLLITPDAYHVVDYKTNDTSATTTAELAEHYRPQLLSYALALMQHDPERAVRASLRFTDAGAEESVEWSPGEREEIAAELASMLEAVESG